jgi:SpoVK/Ycf46/Vps4 family AAA+-type ATPase
MREHNRVSADAVSRLPELAARTKNFSGAEIEGLVKSAASFAFQRNVNVKDVRITKYEDVITPTITWDYAGTRRQYSEPVKSQPSRTYVCITTGWDIAKDGYCCHPQAKAIDESALVVQLAAGLTRVDACVVTCRPRRSTSQRWWCNWPRD